MKFYFPLILCSLFFASTIHAQTKNTSTKFFSKSPNKMYLGAVLSKKSINTEKHELIDFKSNIKLDLLASNIKYEFPAYNPSLENMIKIIREEIKKNGLPVTGTGAAVGSVAKVANIQSINNYFGETMDLSKWLNIDAENVGNRNIMAVSFEVPLFDLFLDVSSQELQDYQEEIKNLKNEDLFYIWGINWGRKALVIIQSDFDESKMTPVINKIIAGESLTENEKIIFETSTISYNIFQDYPLKLDTENPFKAIVDYLNAPITADNYGSVIQIFGNNLDGTTFENSY